MQLFIPLLDPRDCAKCLDVKRLGKQRLEALQLLKLLRTDIDELSTKKTGYRNHPLVAMYRGYDDFVAYYYNCILNEWISRGYKNNMAFQTIHKPLDICFPAWWFDDKIHKLHRANLVFKQPSYYRPLWNDVQPSSGYIWCQADGSQRRFIVPKPKRTPKKSLSVINKARKPTIQKRKS